MSVLLLPKPASTITAIWKQRANWLTPLLQRARMQSSFRRLRLKIWLPNMPGKRRIKKSPRMPMKIS
jgi:hypothetical protein